MRRAVDHPTLSCCLGDGPRRPNNGTLTDFVLNRHLLDAICIAQLDRT